MIFLLLLNFDLTNGKLDMRKARSLMACLFLPIAPSRQKDWSLKCISMHRRPLVTMLVGFELVKLRPCGLDSYLVSSVSQEISICFFQIFYKHRKNLDRGYVPHVVRTCRGYPSVRLLSLWMMAASCMCAAATKRV